ncbi:hypothetical protein BDF14DRAFT_1832114, partial [Spinellus fusiger]
MVKSVLIFFFALISFVSASKWNIAFTYPIYGSILMEETRNYVEWKSMDGVKFPDRTYGHLFLNLTNSFTRQNLLVPLDDVDLSQGYAMIHFPFFHGRQDYHLEMYDNNDDRRGNQKIGESAAFTIIKLPVR